MLWAFKLHGCRSCGRKPPDEVPFEELHCHHRDPETKRHYGNNNVLATGGGLATSSGSNYELLDELLKCDVLCAECHKKERNRNRPSIQESLFSGTGEPWRY